MNEHTKILLATQTINFLSARLQQMICDLNLLQVDPGGESVAGHILGNHYTEMQIVFQNLSKVAEDIGNYLNDCDAVETLDEELTEAAFKYLR